MLGDVGYLLLGWQFYLSKRYDTQRAVIFFSHLPVFPMKWGLKYYHEQVKVVPIGIHS